MKHIDQGLWIRARLGARAIALLGVLSALPGALSAQQAKAITFDDAIKIALERNGTLRLAKNSASVSDLSVTQSKMAFLPDLRFSTSTGADIGRNFNQGEGTITNTSTQSLNLGVSSSVTLFNGGRNVADLKAAQLDNAATDQDLKRATQTVVFSVASNYLALINGQEQLRVQTENYSAQQAQEALIKRFVDAGARPISDLYQQ